MNIAINLMFSSNNNNKKNWICFSLFFFLICLVVFYIYLFQFIFVCLFVLVTFVFFSIINQYLSTKSSQASCTRNENFPGKSNPKIDVDSSWISSHFNTFANVNCLFFINRIVSFFSYYTKSNDWFDSNTRTHQRIYGMFFYLFTFCDNIIIEFQFRADS